jgi:predicted double-glycine peptidase
MLAAGVVRAGTIWLPGSEVTVNVPASSMAERKFREVVKQQYDFSCGSAALATLLTYHYDYAIDEMTAFRDMYEHGDQAKISQAGFSLLDMKNYLAKIGYDSDGFQSDLITLENAGIPAIALINYRGYRHFVVVKGVRRDSVLLGDPALGTRLVARAEFEAMWDNGVLFIIKNKPEVGRKFFNTEQQWQHLASAPLGTAVGNDDLASLTVNLPRLGEF